MKHNIPRATLVSIVGATPTLQSAARVLGFTCGSNLRRRLRDEGLQVKRSTLPNGQLLTVVEDVRE